MNWLTFSAFVSTFFLVSITPGLCMTMAMSLGLSLGVRRTLWMIVGELLGVAIVAIAAAVGVATIMLQFPWLFLAFKIAGGLYLMFLGYELWRSKGRLALHAIDTAPTRINRRALAWQGFVTAIANPKGWAFFIALLPPFISPEYPMATQLPILILIILFLEFVCLLIYAAGGKTVRVLLQNSQNIKLINRLAGTLMVGVGVWLMMS